MTSAFWRVSESSSTPDPQVLAAGLSQAAWVQAAGMVCSATGAALVIAGWWRRRRAIGTRGKAAGTQAAARCRQRRRFAPESTPIRGSAAAGAA
jgi:hypothetical protein